MPLTLTQHEFEQIISRSPYFANIPDSAAHELVAASKIVEYKTNEFIFTIGEVTTFVFCILSGRVRVSIASSAGDEFAVTDFKAEQWLGQESLFNDKPRLLNMQAKEPTNILKIPRKTVLEIGASYPLMYRSMLAHHIELTRGMYELLGGMLFYPLKSRLAGRILILLQEYGEEADHGIYLSVKLSQNDFARLSMGSRQRINKIFREWNKDGIVIMKSDRYFIPDVEILEREAELDT